MPRTSTTEAMNTKLKPRLAKEIVQKYHHKLVLFIPYLLSGRRIGQPAREPTNMPANASPKAPNPA